MPTRKKTSMSRRDSLEIKKLEKTVRGLKANIVGRDYEQKVANYYIKKGWKKIEMHKKVKGYDIDVYGRKTVEDDYGFEDITEHLIIECKNKINVTKADVMNFEKTLVAFGKQKHVTAVIAYTGSIDKSVPEAIRGFKPHIRLIHLPL